MTTCPTVCGYYHDLLLVELYLYWKYPDIAFMQSWYENVCTIVFVPSSCTHAVFVCYRVSRISTHLHISANSQFWMVYVYIYIVHMYRYKNFSVTVPSYPHFLDSDFQAPMGSYSGQQSNELCATVVVWCRVM